MAKVVPGDPPVFSPVPTTPAVKAQVVHPLMSYS